MRSGSLQGMVIETEDIEATQKLLQARGVETSPIGSESWGRYFTCADPDGNGLVINQAPSAT